MSFRDVMSVTCFIDNQTGKEVCLADIIAFMEAGGSQNVFIQEDAPTDPPDTYLWIQTNIGGNPALQTFWVEDGT